MEFSSADRNADAEYSAGLKNYNNNVEQYNKNLTGEKLKFQDSATGLEEGAQSSAHLGALQQAGQHVNAVAGAVKTAVDVQKASVPLKASKDIEMTDLGKGALEGGDAELEVATTTLGKAAGKAGSVLGVIGDVGSIGLDISADTGGGWNKMSVADKIANVADIGGAGLDMIGTGLMTFGGPVGMALGGGLKLFGDITEVLAGTETAVSGEVSVSDKQKAIAVKEKADEAKLGQAKDQAQAVASEAGGGDLAVARKVQL